jgi:hypothetical protein
MSTLANLMGDTTQSPPSQDWGLQNATNWHLQYCAIPHNCFLTGKKLWLTKCYRGQRLSSLPTDIAKIYEFYYIEKTAFLKWNFNGRK